MSTRAAILALLLAGSAHAQQPDAWMLEWSPLARIADLPRTTPALSSLALLRPLAPIGLGWSAHNPAGLAWETTGQYAELGAFARRTDGEFRRPLEPAGEDVRSGQAVAWQPVGTHAAMAGHASLAEWEQERGRNAISFDPYASTPFASSDTALAGMRGSRARLDGAAAWRIGRNAVGVALGYDAGDANGTGTRVPRITRHSEPAAAIGIAHAVTERLRVGVHLRASGVTEVINIAPSPGATLLVRGNGPSVPLVVGITPGRPYTERRRAERGAAGISAAGAFGSWYWAVGAEAGRVTDEYWTQLTDSPPKDAWQAASIELNGALRRALGAGNTLLASLRWVTLDGDARLSGADSVVFTANEQAVQGTAGIRREPAGGTWSMLVQTSLAYERRDRADGGAVLRTLLESLTPTARIEVAGRVHEALRIAAGYELRGYAPRGSMPGPQHYRAELRPLAGGEDAFNAQDALAHNLQLGAEWRVRESARLRLSGELLQAAPAGGGVFPAYAPQGERRSWSLALTAVLGQ